MKTVCIWVKKAAILLSGGEIFLFLYIIAGQFKVSLPTILYIDTTLFFMILATICIAYKLFVIKKRPPLANVIVYIAAFAGVALFFVISSLYTATPIYAREKLIDLILLNGWLVVASAVLLDSASSARKIFLCYIVWSAYGSVYSIIRYISTGIAWNLTPFNTNYLTLSRFIAPACFICLCYYLWGNSKWSKWALAPFALFMYTVILLSARSAILVAAVVLIMFITYLLFAGKHANAGKKKTVISILASCLVATIAFASGATDMAGARLSASLQDSFLPTVVVDERIEELLEGDDRDLVQLHIAPDYLRDEIYLSATDYQKFAMDVLENFGDLIYSRYEYNNMDMPLHFDVTLYRNIVGSGRFTLFMDAFRGIAARPLTGWGLGGYSLITLNSDARAYPHNPVLELWVEGGAFSLIPYAFLILSPLLSLFWAFLHKKEKTFEVNALLAMTLFIVLASMFSNITGGSRAMYMILGAACNVGSWAGSKPARYETALSDWLQKLTAPMLRIREPTE